MQKFESSLSKFSFIDSHVSSTAATDRRALFNLIYKVVEQNVVLSLPGGFLVFAGHA